jgi:hypothetical protein
MSPKFAVWEGKYFSLPSKEPKDYHGIVLILDALGSKTLSQDGSKKFIIKRKNFIDNLNFYHIKLKKVDNEIRGNLSLMVPFTFGDTMILAWSMPENDYDYHKYLPIVHEYVMPIISLGLESGLLWRGCISCGDFCLDEESNTIIGPAVADAAQWYERARWVGIINSPFCGKYISMAALELGGISSYLSIFCEYCVPLKNDNSNIYKEKMWVVSWPAIYDINLPSRARFYKDISPFPVAKGTEDILYATIEFVNWFLRQSKRRGGLESQLDISTIYSELEQE